MQTLKLPRWELLPDIGLYMDQVITLLQRAFDGMLPPGEITKSMVNNYVKAGLLRRPQGKKYSREHLAVLLEIAVLKQALSMEEIAQVLKTLCAGGVREGYARFCALAQTPEAQEQAAKGEECTPQETALALSVTAAVYAIRAKRAICAAREEKI